MGIQKEHTVLGDQYFLSRLCKVLERINETEVDGGSGDGYSYQELFDDSLALCVEIG